MARAYAGCAGQVVGYHSNRRVPNRTRLEGVFMPLYAELRRIEGSHANAKEGLAASSRHLADLMTNRGLSYDEFVFTA